MVAQTQRTMASSGYKQAEIGIIPEDWQFLKIQSLLDQNFIRDHLDGNHGDLYPRSNEFKDNGIPYIGANDFLNGEVDFAGCKFLSEQRAKQFKKGVACDGDVLFAHNATVGPVALLKTDLEFVILSTTATYFRCNNEKLNNKFLQYSLQTNYFVKQYRAVMSQSTRFQVPITTQRKFSLLLPPLPEQRIIAMALSDVGDLITSLDKIITKKKNIKQGAMQDLLSGKRRLQGFSGKWELKEFRDVISEFSAGATPYRGKPEYYHGQIRWITSGELNYNYITDTKEKISENGRKKANLKLHPKGTFLMAITGLEAETTRGRCGIIGEPSTTNQSCMALYPKDNLSLEFLFHYYRLKGNELAFKYCQGTKQQSYTARIVKILPIRIPPTKEEQIAIAQILSDIDSEIRKLEKRRDKYIMIKNGMMQKLLTGEIRLK